jgi:NrS-1  polymerase HBD domain
MLPRPDPEHDSHLHENVPEPLKARACWMGTKLSRKPDGRLNKPPYRVQAGQPMVKADKTNSKNHATFEEAHEALVAGAVDAIGFVFTKNDPFTVVDKDDAVDPDTGEMNGEAADLLARFDGTYWEISISGTGLHIICEAQKPGSSCKKGGVEIYDGCSGARFIVLTGRGSGELRLCQEEVNALYREVFGEDKPPPVVNGGNRGILPPAAILEKARNSKTGAKFIKHYDHGDRSGYDSPSDADYSLINMLIFWCAGDADMVEDLFRSSALYRPPPEKHKGYVGISVRNALKSYRGSFYRPKALREETTPKQRDILMPYLALLLDAAWWKGPKAAGAYKAYAALVIGSVEDGISTDAEELRIGADVRSLAERAGLNRVTLCRSSLPYLVEQKLVKWQRGAGNRAGQFILRRPKVPSEATIKVSTEYFNGSTHGDGLDALAKLIRMRSGVSKTGKVTHLGAMQTAARLGMVVMFCLVTFTTAPRGQNIDQVVERTGRRKDHVRTALQKLVKAEILEEGEGEFFTFAPAFWSAYQRALIGSGIVASEHRQRRQHEQERRDNELKLKAGRDKAQKFDQNVIDFDAERRKKLDKAARREQPVDDRHLTEREKQKREELALLEAYDLKCVRVQERLARRPAKAAREASW